MPVRQLHFQDSAAKIIFPHWQLVARTKSEKVINSTTPGILGYIHRSWINFIWDCVIWQIHLLYSSHISAPKSLSRYSGDIERTTLLGLQSLPTLRCNTRVLWIQVWNQNEKPSGVFARARLGGSAARFGLLGSVCSVRFARFGLLGSVCSGSVCATKPSCSAERARFDYTPGLLSLR